MAQLIHPEEVMLFTAISAAILFHKNQKDRAGVPFYHHLLRVGIAMSPDAEAMVIGFIHDLAEDTNQTIDDIEYVFGSEIAHNVWLLTRQAHENYWTYLDRLIAESKHYPKALLVKRADLLDNLSPWRQTFPGADSLRRRHEIALHQIEQVLVSRGLLNESERYDGIRGTETGRVSGEYSSHSYKFGRAAIVGKPQATDPTTTSTVAPVPGAPFRDPTIAGNLYGFGLVSSGSPSPESKPFDPDDDPF